MISSITSIAMQLPGTMGCIRKKNQKKPPQDFDRGDSGLVRHHWGAGAMERRAATYPQMCRSRDDAFPVSAAFGRAGTGAFFEFDFR